jgi:3D (Asp-Asp-Asp) domain-containing protein
MKKLNQIQILGIFSISIFLLIAADNMYFRKLLKGQQIELNREDSLFKDLYYSIVDSNEQDAFLVTATSYNLSVYQCDSDYMTPASGFKFKSNIKYVALSRDLLEEFCYGEQVILENCGSYNGKYIVADAINKRYARRVDILIPKENKHFMFKNAIIKRINN